MKRLEKIPSLPPRPTSGHKGTFGTVVVAAGSVGIAGAAALCARAVLRSGAGLCKVACPEEVQPQIAVLTPCATTLPINCADQVFGGGAVPAVLAAMEQAGVLALGPGIGQGPGQRHFVRDLLAASPVPTLVDADGLNALAGLFPDVLARKEGAGPLVLTPHPGEAGRLLGVDAAEIQSDRQGAAVKIAKWCGGVCLLKGERTLVTDGTTIFVNETGNSGMATGGSGDVLTGIIAALLAQGMEPLDGAALGAHLHGLAGDFGVAELGAWSLQADDLLHYLPRAFCAHRDAGEVGA